MKFANYVLASSVVLASQAYAGIELGSDKYILSGFATYSAARSDNVVPWYVHRGISKDWCFDCDATLGLQLDAYFSDSWRASMQVVKRPQDNYNSPNLEWAYVAYAPDLSETSFDSTEIEFRAGKLRLPLLLNSAYYFVGNAYPWMRPNSQVYNRLLGITAFEGLEAVATITLNDSLSLTVEPFYGFEQTESVYRVDQSLIFGFDYMGGLSVDLSGEQFKLHASYMRSDTSLDIELYEGDQTTNLFIGKGKYEVHSVGLIYNFENGFDLWSEFIDDRQSKAYYLGGVYNRDEFSTYAVFGETYDTTTSSGDEWTLGLRYNIQPNLSLNLEWTHYRATYPFDPMARSQPKGQFVYSPYKAELSFGPGGPPQVTWVQLDDTEARIATIGLNYNF